MTKTGKAKMKTKYKYIHFERRPIREGIKIKGQTHLWYCFANKSKITVGTFHYNFKWKCWEFWPSYSSTFTPDCLADIKWKCWEFQPEGKTAFTGDCLADIISFMKLLEKPK